MTESKLTAKAAIHKVLDDAGKPMSVVEIIAAAVPLTALSGKTPGQTIYSVLYAENKKKSGAFNRVSRGRFALRRTSSSQTQDARRSRSQVTGGDRAAQPKADPPAARATEA